MDKTNISLWKQLRRRVCRQPCASEVNASKLQMGKLVFPGEISFLQNPQYVVISDPFCLF